MSDPRYEAYKILLKIEKDHSYSVLSVTEALKSVEFADARDTSFVVSLVYGVLERKITLDYNIGLYLSTPIKKIKPNVLILLRIGAYQIMYMDKIPDRAAVNESVSLSKNIGAGYASGLVNAILRKISVNGSLYPEKNDSEKYLSVSYSINLDIVKSMISDYGLQKTESVLDCFFGRRPVFIRCNLLKCSVEKLVELLENANVNVELTDIPGCLKIDNSGDITKLEAFKNGMFYVQDMSSQLCCLLAGVTPGVNVVDCCAAPGGKSFTMAQYLQGKGSIVSCDVHPHKKQLLEEGAKRLGIENLTVVCSDARVLNKTFSNADVVLCDVPCSGFGVMGRKPEIRYKKSEDFEQLPSLQYEILSSCSEIVKPGGTLLYSTCTLNKRENDLVCDKFLIEHPDFTISLDCEYQKYSDRYITVFPENEGGDGFFIAKFTRC